MIAANPREEIVRFVLAKSCRLTLFRSGVVDGLCARVAEDRVRLAADRLDFAALADASRHDAPASPRARAMAALTMPKAPGIASSTASSAASRSGAAAMRQALAKAFAISGASVFFQP